MPLVTASKSYQLFLRLPQIDSDFGPYLITRKDRNGIAIQQLYRYTISHSIDTICYAFLGCRWHGVRGDGQPASRRLLAARAWRLRSELAERAALYARPRHQPSPVSNTILYY